MLTSLRDFLADRPAIFAYLRKMLELGFIKQKAIVREVFGAGGGKVLDIGCGTGEFASLFSNFDYYGIDIFSNYVEYARRKNKGKFFVMDATKLKFGDEIFDEILIMAVLHHLDDPDVIAVLREAKRVLRPGGKLLIMEDARIKEYENSFIRLAQNFDKGGFIRKPEEYKNIILDFFKIVREWSFRSGGCVYYGSLLEK
ncbi:methyltransferase domain-containing protein [Patescibacteria group bacterium]|nr:methyltransferase domain-containing protein [Patescibacteria group bacterium]